MATRITEETESTIVENEDGVQISKTIKQKTNKTAPSGEPGFVKIYIKKWSEINDIPLAARDLFIELCMRMSYADPKDYDGGQIVYLISPVSDDIMRKLSIKKSRYQQLLKMLCDCHAIRRLRRGMYQINPAYAGKGLWKYNPRLEQGGIEDIVPHFNCADASSVENTIIWGDDGTKNEFNKMYRNGLDVSPTDEAVLKELHIEIEQTPEEDSEKGK